ncbi:hypothetical protein HHI36_007785 [Cryptolaemus montrouzieri]|uniref:Uncharacterized protein n=1 Tax=Cryptolaemus montrouzieri TaxID=559131 RepID=A0ABD2MQR9_9CUCU
MKEWVTCDSNEQGFQIMSDDSRKQQQEMQEDVTEENIDMENDTGPSNDVAFHACFKTENDTDSWQKVLTENENISWCCNLCLVDLKKAINCVTTKEANNYTMLKSQAEYLSKELSLVQKRMSEMEHTLILQKKVIESLEYQSQLTVIKESDISSKCVDVQQVPVKKRCT